MALVRKEKYTVTEALELQREGEGLVESSLTRAETKLQRKGWKAEDGDLSTKYCFKDHGVSRSDDERPA